MRASVFRAATRKIKLPAIPLVLLAFVLLGTHPSFAQRSRRKPAINQTLRRELLLMETEDQRYRGLIETELIKMSSSGSSAASDSYIEAVRKQDAIDAENILKLDAIIKKFGWPVKSVAGDDGSKAAFLVLQHSDVRYQEKYLPLLKAAAKNGEARLADAAMLEDRVLVRRGKKQIFGTQLHSGPETGGKLVLSPIEDEEHVDQRRASVGLMPLAEYLKHFGLVYKPGASQ